MNILENNINLLNRLRMEYPNAFNGITINDSFLTYNSKNIDISKYNLYDLISGQNPSFGSQLSALSPEDVFKIININVIFSNSISNDLSESIQSTNDNSQKNQRDNEKDLEKIQKIDPLMKRVSIITKRDENGFKKEYFNVVDSNGTNHLFDNNLNLNINIIELYGIIKSKYSDHDINPEELIHEMNSKFTERQLYNSISIINNDKYSESFQNKISMLDEKYKSNPLIRVSGNEELDIIIVSDISNPEYREIYTYTRNEFGDLVQNSHNQDFELNENNEYNVSESDKDEKIQDNKQEETIVKLVSEEKFYNLLYKNEEYTPEEANQVNDYYGFFTDCMIYEGFLEPEILDMLYRFNHKMMEFEVNGDVLTIHQKEAVEKYYEMLQQKQNKIQQNQLESNKELIEEKGKQLKLVYDNKDNAAFVSTLQIIGFIVGAAVILIAVTLYVIQ